MQNNEKGIFLTLLNIYWPGVLFGGVQLGFTLIRRGTAPLEKRLADVIASPGDYLIWLALLSGCILLTVLLILLMCCGKAAAPSDREEQMVDVTDVYADEDEHFPGLNYRLRPEKRSGEPTLVEKVIVPHTVAASARRRPADSLQLMAGDQEKLSVPLKAGTHTVQVGGCTVTVTIERNGLEDVTRELPRL